MHQHYDCRQRAKQKAEEDKYRIQQQFFSSQNIGLNSKTTKRINKTLKFKINSTTKSRHAVTVTALTSNLWHR